MKKSKTVVLWGREDLLGRAVEFFLTTRKDWEVIRIADSQTIDALIEEVQKVKPDVVIIYQGDCAGSARLPVQLLLDCVGIKVITVSLENNSVEVYNRQKVWVKEANDLLSFMED